MSKILTFEDFKQQVAEKYGWKTFEDLEKDYRITINKEKEYLIEASELYAQYQREEGRKEINHKLIDACKTVVDGYEGDGMEGMRARDRVFYKYCKEAIINGKKEVKP